VRPKKLFIQRQLDFLLSKEIISPTVFVVLLFVEELNMLSVQQKAKKTWCF